MTYPAIVIPWYDDGDGARVGAPTTGVGTGEIVGRLAATSSLTPRKICTCNTRYPIRERKMYRLIASYNWIKSRLKTKRYAQYITTVVSCAWSILQQVI